jgi:translation initiation factor 2B subunit (eIF-2B alpha/beta/delta family)
MVFKIFFSIFSKKNDEVNKQTKNNEVNVQAIANSIRAAINWWEKIVRETEEYFEKNFNPETVKKLENLLRVCIRQPQEAYNNLEENIEEIFHISTKNNDKGESILSKE